ncbi:MAG TPA: response regulator [Pyrinomonadaceae bacterium]|jgi:two-component system cell cycle response regulator DivK|nr:response regulator [Pyrinomonadaceae bacterium]
MAKNVLVVEDYEDVRTMMKIMVQLYGYNVVEARDGVEAIEKVKQHCPDLILMDIAMPLMDGLSAARVIKTFEHCSKVPVIAVTAYHNMRDEAFEAGCVDVLEKPVEFPHLKQVLASHLT